MGVGQTATFTVVATSALPVTYQWQKNGANISGATAPSYTTPPLTAADNGSMFDVVVTNAVGSTTSIAVSLTVNKKLTPAISWAAPPAVTYGTALGAAQLDASADVPGTFVYTPAAGTLPGAGSQTLSVTFTPDDIADYNSGTDTVTLTVNRAAPAIAIAGGSFTYDGTTHTAAGTATGKGGVAVPGIFGFIYSPGGASPPANAGSYEVTAAFVSSDPNYANAMGSSTLNITQAPQTISFAALPNATYGSAPITLTASASSGLLVTYSVSGPATLSGSALSFTGAGSISVTASQLGDSNHTAALPVQQTLTVIPAVLTVTAANATRVYGVANPTFTATISGYVNEDTSSVVSGTPAVSTTATTSSAAGNYAITAATGSLAASNYTFSFALGTLTVNPAVLTVTAANSTRAYGAANPAFTATISGYVNGDTSSVVSGTPAVSTTATTASAVGNYAITTALGSLAASNYTFSFAPGTLAVSPAVLSVTADNATRTYGVANPAFTATISGYVNGDTSSVVSGTPAVSTTATTASAVGNYAITAAGGTLVAMNYTFSFALGTLTITQASPAINWAPPAAIIYGIALSGTELNATASFSGSNVPGTFSYVPAAGAVLGSGNHTLSVTFAPADTADYAGANATVNLIVNAPASITSGSVATFQESIAGTFTVTATGFPTPAISALGTLPSGMTLTDNGNGTATLAGTPGPGTGGSYAVVIAADNGIETDPQQNFTLLIDARPAILSGNNTTFNVSTPGTFSVSTSGFPAPTITSAGTLPSGVSFSANGNGTATLSGTPDPSTAGSYAVTFTAHNGVGTDAVQNFTLTINGSPLITIQPTSQTLIAGQTVTFTVAATGTPPLAYQWLANGLPIGNANSASYKAITSLGLNNTEFSVLVSNAFGSMASHIATLTVIPDTTPPSVPTNLAATSMSASQVNLVWNASTDDVGVAGYNLYRNGSQIATTTGTFYPDTGLTPLTTYNYAVSAYDAAGNVSGQSLSASSTTGEIPSDLGWYQIPNTAFVSVQQTSWPGAGAPANVMSAWSGGAYDFKRNRLMIWGGGHTDYYGNEVYALDLNAKPIAPLRLNSPDQYLPDGMCHNIIPGSNPPRPSSRHTYEGLTYLPTQDKLLAMGGSQADSGCFGNDLFWFDPATLAWSDLQDQVPGWSSGIPICDYDPNQGQALCFNNQSGDLWVYNAGGNTMTSMSSQTGGFPNLGMSGVVDPVGRRFYVTGLGYLGYYDISGPTPFSARVHITNGSGCDAFTAGRYPGLQYDPVENLIVEWSGGNTINTYDPATNTCNSQTFIGGPGPQQTNGTHGRFRYVAAMGVFIVCNSWAQNCYSLRLTSPAGDPISSSFGTIISNVEADAITTSGATIRWNTNTGSTSQLDYGLTNAYGSVTTLDPSLVTSHSQTLSALSPLTAYHYRVHSIDSTGLETITNDFTFVTAGIPDNTPPTVSITLPLNGTTVAGIVTLTASASDNVGVTGVQLLLNGTNLGSIITSPPYSTTWDSTGSINGIYTLTAQAFDAAGNIGLASVSVTVSNSPSSVLQDFQTRCAQAGVLVCQGFDDPSVAVPATYPASGLYPGDQTSGTIDTSVAASGAGSLKFTLPSFGTPNSAGFWRQLTTSNLSAGPNQAQVFGPGGTFYVQFRQRFSHDFLRNQWPQAPQFGGGLTYWKQEIFSNDQQTCSNEELTTVNGGNHGYPIMYSQCGQDVFQIPFNGDYLNEQGDTATTGYNCHYSTSSTCFMYPENMWVTFYYKVSVGQWGQPNSTIQAWVALPGQQYQEWVNITNHPLFQDGTLPGYDMVTLLPYMTNRDQTISAGPVSYTWYDELIISTQPIAAPTQ